ncbi:hypothetical protein HHL28_08510 [Aerophototrophica crusticola]|uniref:Uncharacterized protein n=1 Tax=Aerophototrophica crusticola TaxID=1709002 RepID=A0A858R6U8_9PROT|nr:hypothetical protein HHL28_08510 [Rhodospirillaceae bacterium B3]
MATLVRLVPDGGAPSFRAALDRVGPGARIHLTCYGLMAAGPVSRPFNLYLGIDPAAPPALWPRARFVGALSFFNAVGRSYTAEEDPPIDFSAEVTGLIGRRFAEAGEIWVGILHSGPIAAGSDPRLHSLSLIAGG